MRDVNLQIEVHYCWDTLVPGGCHEVTGIRERSRRPGQRDAAHDLTAVVGQVGDLRALLLCETGRPNAGACVMYVLMKLRSDTAALYTLYCITGTERAWKVSTRHCSQLATRFNQGTGNHALYPNR
jgi:hypothetical protein